MEGESVYKGEMGIENGLGNEIRKARRVRRLKG